MTKVVVGPFIVSFTRAYLNEPVIITQKQGERMISPEIFKSETRLLIGVKVEPQLLQNGSMQITIQKYKHQPLAIEVEHRLLRQVVIMPLLIFALENLRLQKQNTRKIVRSPD